MADIAQIGFAADTSQLNDAKTSLQALVPAATSAAKAADNVSDSLNSASNAAANVSKAAQGMARDTNASTKVVKAAGGVIVNATDETKDLGAANDNAADKVNKHAAAHKGLSTQAMAAQHSIRSAVEGLASGVPVTQVLTQQLNHLSFAASGPGGITKAFSDAIGMFTKLISGTTAVIAAIAAVVVAFGFIANSVIKSELALDDLHQSIDVSIANLHGLQQAMSLKGISNDEFISAMTKFSASVDDAQHNVGSLNGLMIASGMKAKDLQGYMMNVADLVAKTTDGVQKRNILEAAGLPTTAQFVRFMSQGGDAIKAATQNSVEFNDAAEKNLIQKARDFDDAWNKATTNLQQYFKSIVIDNLDWVVKLGQILEIASKLHAIAGSAVAPKTQQSGSLDPNSKNFIGPQPLIGPPAPSPVATAAKGAQPETQAQVVTRNQQDQARIGILGDLATVQQQVASKQAEINIANANGIGPSKEMAAAIKLGVQAQAEQNRVNQQAAAGIFDLNAAQKAASDTLQHWIDQKLVDPTNTQQMAAAQLVLARNIKATSDAAAVAAAPLQGLKQLELDGANLAKSLDTATTGALNNLVQPIQDMMNGVTGLSKGFKNLGVVVLQAIQQMIIKMLILTPIAKALQAIMGGLFGGITVPGAVGPTSLGGAPLVGAAKGRVFANDNITKFARGSAFTNKIVSQRTLFSFANGTAMGEMGEAGSEAIMPLKRGPNGSLGVQMYQQSSGNSKNTSGDITFNHSPNYYLGGNVTQDDLNNVKKAQAKSDAEFVSRVGKAIPELRKRNARV